MTTYIALWTLNPALIVTVVALVASAGARAAPSVPESAVDAQFSAWTSETPGCAVGVSKGGRILLERAYGMAELEHGVANRPDTIFEAGSVSKQFTAAAVLLLASDGKLSLDDPIQKYIPELPDYAAPVTIRQMLHHTSGLRDWGSIEWIAGWPRGTRVYTHAHVLDVLSPAAAPQFRARHALVLQQFRVQPLGRPGVARRRRAVRRLHPQAHFRAARHDAHVLAR